MAKITAPEQKGHPPFTGAVAGVNFVDGVGETRDEAAIAYFERHGYKVALTAAEKRAVTAADPDEAGDQADPGA